MEEVRSFAPADGDRPVKTRPVPTKGATNAQLAKGINDLHECLEDTRSDLKLILRAFRIQSDDEPSAAPHPKLPRVKQHLDWKTVVTIVSATGGAVALVQVLNAVVPPMWQALVSLPQ